MVNWSKWMIVLGSNFVGVKVGYHYFNDGILTLEWLSRYNSLMEPFHDVTDISWNLAGTSSWSPGLEPCRRYHTPSLSQRGVSHTLGCGWGSYGLDGAEGRVAGEVGRVRRTSGERWGEGRPEGWSYVHCGTCEGNDCVLGYNVRTVFRRKKQSTTINGHSRTLKFQKSSFISYQTVCYI